MWIFWGILWDFDHLTWTFRLAHNSHPKLKLIPICTTNCSVTNNKQQQQSKNNKKNKMTEQAKKKQETQKHTHTLPTVFSLQKSQTKILHPSQPALPVATAWSGTNGCRGGASGLPCATQKSLRGRSKEALRRSALGEKKNSDMGKNMGTIWKIMVKYEETYGNIWTNTVKIWWGTYGENVWTNMAKRWKTKCL